MISLQDISNAVQERFDLEFEIAKREQEIKDLNKKLTNINEETIPCAFQELGIKEIKLENGQKVKVDQDIYSSLSNEDKPRAYAWLTSHEYGGLIKVELSINYSKGEKENAEVMKKLLSEGCGLDDNFSIYVSNYLLESGVDEETATCIYEILSGGAHPVDLSENVHHATLAAFLRERVREGSEIPLDLFGARPVFKTKVTKAK